MYDLLGKTILLPERVEKFIVRETEHSWGHVSTLVGIDAARREVLHITTTHTRDCCEHNYADFESFLELTHNILPMMTLHIDVCEGGFTINGQMVACYSDQYGHYSEELSLAVSLPVPRSSQPVVFTYEIKCKRI